MYQAPSGYYIGITGTGYTFKTQLYIVIKGQLDQGYAGLWIIYVNIDRGPSKQMTTPFSTCILRIKMESDPYTFTLTTGNVILRCRGRSSYNREHDSNPVFNSHLWYLMPIYSANWWCVYDLISWPECITASTTT
jgi:hypothetical protein